MIALWSLKIDIFPECAVRNKRKDSRSDMSDFWHKYMDSCGEMIVSSGIKTGTPVTMKMT